MGKKNKFEHLFLFKIIYRSHVGDASCWTNRFRILQIQHLLDSGDSIHLCIPHTHSTAGPANCDTENLHFPSMLCSQIQTTHWWTHYDVHFVLDLSGNAGGRGTANPCTNAITGRNWSKCDTLKIKMFDIAGRTCKFEYLYIYYIRSKGWGFKNGNFPLLYVMKVSLHRWVGGSKKPQNNLTKYYMNVT